MDLMERDVGDFRIYAGALEAPMGGYTAAVEVHRVRGVPNPPQVVFSSDRMSGGHRFEQSAAALRHALNMGHQAIRLRETALAA
ncbi:hypothetical protein [uncultured Methylibium sp.]|uniref:hypothetical protein n=1 Tax=uncultured Methylibium sp. TaxID=381093 RepID=UPI0025DD4379|nr:hypothetical protein [uncultured Methylibium sp.]